MVLVLTVNLNKYEKQNDTYRTGYIQKAQRTANAY